MINIGTDGACKGNPGPGGWGVAVFQGTEQIDERYDGEINTTNNRMEIIAFINACAYIIEHDILPEDVIIHIDSTYVLKGATEWLRGWRAKDYKGVKNDDLWREVADLRHIWLDCDLRWVKGHSGDIYNEAADDAANKGVQAALDANDDW